MTIPSCGFLQMRVSVAFTTLCVFTLFSFPPPLRAVDATGKRTFDVAAGDAPASFKQFAQQAGVELLYSPKEIAGAKTNAVKGYFTPHDALRKLLEGTKLIITAGKTSGALAVTRATAPNG
jgi:hypothetical protein